jgi:diguanylate cyclase (GGDEF)-like protein
MTSNRESDNCDGTAAESDPGAAGETEANGPIDLLLAQKKQLEQLNAWFDIALNNMVRGLSMFDADQRLIVCNNSYRQMYALPETLARPGTPLAEIVRYHVMQETGRDGEAEVAKQAEWIAQHVEKLREGRTFSHVQTLRDGRKFMVTYQPLAEGGWVDIQEDVTEKRQAQERMEWLARHDALTGVGNRFYFRETFEKVLADLDAGSDLALHWIDLDRFKAVNDTFGHPTGDALLQVVADRLRRSLRRTDFLARLGGDEFAVIQSEARGPEQCQRLARRILREISKPYQIFGKAICISASIGIVRAPEHGRTADELLKNADLALYSMKSAGRHAFAMYECTSYKEFDAERELENDIKSALANDQFELYYQPILNLGSQHVVSCEALLRWRHPTKGMIAPPEFLPAAERTGAIIDIGQWVLKRACQQAVAWSEKMKVTVNVSQLQFENGDLPALVKKALSASGLRPGRLKLEIGESLLAHDEESVRETLKKLRRLGVGVALDDFGKTVGSLSNLMAFPFDEIKIDRTLVRDTPLRAESAAIVKAVIALAESLGIRSVAEGVETLDELNMVIRAGCTKAQGYYISRPVPIAELDAALMQCPGKLVLAA